MGRVTRRHPVQHLESGTSRRRVETLAVEEPLEIRINGEPFLVTMRTPGDDIDLVHGLLLSESVVRMRSDVIGARYCDGAGTDGRNTYNVLDVRLAGHVMPPLPDLQRKVLTTSACGICGTTTIEQVLRASAFRLPGGVTIRPDVVQTAPEQLRSRQRGFDRTGGLHAAGLMSADGALLCVREDVGRHNAVDKVVGWALREDRLPLANSILIVSGRASFELTQKAVLAGVPLLAAVSAPSSLAVDLAQQAGLTLVGFVRGQTMNIYTHPERVRNPAVRTST
jgi:FdhD protein